MRRAVTILGTADQLKRVKAASIVILPLWRCVERENRSLDLEIFGVVWRGRVAHTARVAVPA